MSQILEPPDTLVGQVQRTNQILSTPAPQPMLPISPVQKIIYVPNPNANTLWQVNIPAGVTWTIKTVFFILTTDATATTRYLGLQTFGRGPGSNNNNLFVAPVSVTASQTAYYNFGKDYNSTNYTVGSGAGAKVYITFPIPGWVLDPDVINAISPFGALGGPADQISATALTIEETPIQT